MNLETGMTTNEGEKTGRTGRPFLEKERLLGTIPKMIGFFHLTSLFRLCFAMIASVRSEKARRGGQPTSGQITQ